MENTEFVLTVTEQKKKRPRRTFTFSFYLSLSLLIFAVLFVVATPLLALYDPYAQNLSAALLAPFESFEHPLGTDPLGRDYMSRLSLALLTSVAIAIGAVLVSFLVGMTIGLLAGWFGGRTDNFLMSAGDIQLAVPVILVLISLVSVLGSNPWLLMLLLGLSHWVSYARVSRALVVSLKEQDFIAAVKTMGGSSPWMMRKHLMPNVLPQLFIISTYELGLMITIETTLSFLGFGIQPPVPSLGGLIGEGHRYMQDNPSLTILPAILMFMVIGGVQFLSQSIFDQKAIAPRRSQ